MKALAAALLSDKYGLSVQLAAGIDTAAISAGVTNVARCHNCAPVATVPAAPIDSFAAVAVLGDIARAAHVPPTVGLMAVNSGKVAAVVAGRISRESSVPLPHVYVQVPVFVGCSCGSRSR